MDPIIKLFTSMTMVLLLWPLLTSGQQELGGIYLNGKITTEQGNVDGTVIKMTRNGQAMRDYQVLPDGKYNLRFEFNYDYVLIFQRNDNFPQKIVINTQVPPEVLRRDRKFPPFPVDVNLFTEIKGIDRTFSENAIMKIFYSPSVDNFIPEVYYNNAQIKRLIDQAIWQSQNVSREAGLLKRLSAAELAELKKEYDELLKKAGSEFDQGDYIASLGDYKSASRIFPNEQYPKDRIAEINDLIAILGLQAELDKENARKYEGFIKEADRHFAVRNWPDAEENYNQALYVKPNDSYASGRLREIALAIEEEEKSRFAEERAKVEAERLAQEQAALAAAEAERDRKYNEAVTLADQAFTRQEYQEAISGYKNALTIKPGESYPAGQIAEAEKIISELAAARRQFDAAVAAGDRAFKRQNYQQARRSFEEALNALSYEPYPAEMIEKINVIEAEQFQQAEEKARIEAERKAQLEAERQAAEAEKQRLAEEKARIEAERQAQLEAQRQAAEAEKQRLAEEKARIEAERQAQLEAQRQAAEAEKQRLAEEKARLAAEKAAKEEEARLAAEAEKQRIAEEKARIEAERKAQLEAERQAAEAEKQRLAEEKARLAAEKAAKEEEARLAAEAEKQRLAEEKARIEAERQAQLEAQRQAAEAEKQRLAEEKARLAAEKAAKEEEARLAAEAEKARVAAEKAAREEEARMAAEAEKQRIAEEKARIEAERKAQLEAERQAAEAEKQRLAEEKAQLAAEKAAKEEEARLAAEAEKQRIADEKARIEAERQAQQEAQRQAAEAEKQRLAEEKARLAAEKAAKEEEVRLAAEAEKQRLAEEKARLAAEKAAREEEARLAAEAEKQRLAEEKARLAAEKAAKEEEARLAAEAEKQRIAEEKARIEAERQAQLEAQRLAAEAEKARLAAEKAAETEARMKLVTGETEALYQGIITTADQNFEEKEYNVSRAWYYKALDVKPEEKYPAGRITEINQIIGTLQMSQREREFQEYIDKGDEAFRSGELAVSRGWYNRALTIRAGDEYARSQIADIQMKIAEQIQGNTETSLLDYLKEGDKALASRNYHIARVWYHRARQLKPDDSRVTEKLQNLDRVMSGE